MKCSACSSTFEACNALATQIYRRNGVAVTVIGIPATAICPHCGNAILEWETAQAVENLVLPLFKHEEPYFSSKLNATITFPKST